MPVSSHNIFLSHSRQNHVVVERFCQWMVEGGFRPWFHQKMLRTGDDGKHALALAFHKALVLICMVSRADCASPVSRKEDLQERQGRKSHSCQLSIVTKQGWLPLTHSGILAHIQERNFISFNA
jgi:TIR domain